MAFPLFSTKVAGVNKSFDLNDPAARKEYFAAKAGAEIAAIRSYLAAGTFVAYLVGKKNSGKGTYSKLFMEAVGADHVGHVSIGDIVRDVHASVETDEGKNALIAFLKKNYRGFHSVDETLDLITGRSQSSLISSELIVALIKYEISKRPKQAIFVDGFPRAHDQISASLYLKELIGYRDDPDFFVFLNVPDTIIDERIKYRVICPVCKTPRNLKLLATKDVDYDATSGAFSLLCDNPSCNKARMVPKEGDALGIEPIRDRLEVDNQIFQKLLTLHGIPKVYLRNSMPVNVADQYADPYELTPAYSYAKNADGTVKTIENRWVVKDDDGMDSYSLLPAAVTVSLIKQIAQVLKKA